jgi:hypothetical protein
MKKLGSSPCRLSLLDHPRSGVKVGGILGSSVNSLLDNRFAFFAMYFLKYNTDRFYDHNQEWENFDQRIGVHRITEDLGYNKTESKNIELSTDAKITPKSIDTL